jgi:nucleoside-diphosphate-sugar epimerase
MRVLHVELSGVLGHRLAEVQGRQHEVLALDEDPRDFDTAARVTASVDAIVCALPELQAGDPDPLVALDRASRGIYNLIKTAAAAGARRFVLLSSLRPFERYPLDHAVTEYWAPRPTTDPQDLIAVVAEAVVREASHTLPLKVICLRLGPVVDNVEARDPRAVHVDDVVQAVERALAFEEPDGEPSTGWRAFHIVGAGRTRFPLGLAGGADRATAIPMATLGYVPEHDVSGGAPPTEINVEPPARFTAQPGGGARRVVIFGAGGPLAAISARALEPDHVLRLCDLRPVAEIVAEGRPQSRGAPVPRVLGQPHDMRAVDVTDYSQVLEATRGMDAVINMTVMRHDPVQAFRVNTLGAYNVIRAAVECGIRRVVQTGPQQVTDTMPGGYWSDVDLPSSVPPRPGVGLYFISKFLGQEIMRIFAQEHDLEVPTLVFGPFTNPDDCEPDELGCYPFLVSWADAAEAVRGALRAPALPHPFEIFHIVADLPHGKYRNDRTKAVLHWQPRDNLEIHWRRRSVDDHDNARVSQL